MMTPKEKAEQFVRTMYNWTFDDRDNPDTPNLAAYKCALIAVDELIESHLLLTTTHDKKASIRCKTYWQEVKQEIEAL